MGRIAIALCGACGKGFHPSEDTESVCCKNCWTDFCGECCNESASIKEWSDGTHRCSCCEDHGDLPRPSTDVLYEMLLKRSAVTDSDLRDEYYESKKMRPTPISCGTCKKPETDCIYMTENSCNDVWGYCCVCAKADETCTKCTSV